MEEKMDVNINKWMNTSKWLEQLKAGDEVAMSRQYGKLPMLASIDKVTETQIIVKDPRGSWLTRFRRSDGRVVGAASWGTTRIVQPSDELRQQIEVGSLQQKVSRLIVEITIPEDKENLLKLIDVLTPFVNTLPSMKKEIE
jgi:hypothetical protein